MSSYEIAQYDDCYIEVHEEYPCQTKAELNRREGQIIRDMDCVNKLIAGRTQTMYVDEEREQINARRRLARANNPEKTAADRAKRTEYQKSYDAMHYTKNQERKKEYMRAYHECKRQEKNLALH